METTDALGDLLLKKGLVPSRYVLDLNHALTLPVTMELPPPWNLPSRLFRFPIEVSEPIAGEGRRIGLMHPPLSEHPFVQHVAAELGRNLDPAGAPNAHGVSKQHDAMWWHAVDLITRRAVARG